MPISPPLPTSSSLVSKGLSYALVGRPNSGKTTIFNALTGLRQKVGNYPGVTVEKRYGSFSSPHGVALQVLDLPGAQSLSPQSPDEAILRDVLFGLVPDTRVDRIVCVIDIHSLEPSLYFALQILELAKPTIVILNNSAKRAIPSAQVQALEDFLGVPVVVYKDKDRESLTRLKLLLSRGSIPLKEGLVCASPALSRAVESLQSSLACSPAEALAYLEGKELKGLKVAEASMLERIQVSLLAEESSWQQNRIQQRYQRIDSFIQSQRVYQLSLENSLSYRIDRWVLHPVFGWFVLIGVFAGIFMGVFSLSIYPMRLLEKGFEGIQGLLNTLPSSHTKDLLCEGVLGGLGNVILFLPQILILFFFIGVLELSGYLPRAIFLLDGPLRKVGLQGRSFIPLLSSYGCAIPGILATRTIGSWPERLATILIAPWISCSARLPIYLILIGVMLPSPLTPLWYKVGFLVAIYSVSTLAALVLAAGLRKYLMQGHVSDITLELPRYQWPSFRTIGFNLYERLRVFVSRTAPFIIAFSIIFWFLSNYPKASPSLQQSPIESSYAGQIGKALEPLIKPLGYDWKIGIGILSSFAARELFISTLGILYNIQEGTGAVEDCGCGCCGQLPASRSKFSSVLLGQQNDQGQRIYTPLSCLSLIIFYMFALQCTSTLVIVRKETGSWKWPCLQFMAMGAFAYIAALIVYQVGRVLGFV